MPVNARLYEYGFYQAIPALLFCALSAWNYGSRLFANSFEARRLFHAVLSGFLGAGLFLHGRDSFFSLRKKTFLVERSSLRLFTQPPPKDPNASALLAATDHILRRLNENPDECFAAVPAGSIVHYLAQIPNHVRFHQLGPYEVGAGGEDAIITAYFGPQRPT